MADWTDIPDENLAPGAPARSADIIALRDNVTAITEGATDAPKIQTAAIDDKAITVDKMYEYTGNTDKTIWSSKSAQVATNGDTERLTTLYIYQGGLYKFTWSASGDANRCLVQVNGTTVYTSSTTSGSRTLSTTQTLSHNDAVSFFIDSQDNSGTSSMSNLSVGHETVVPINGV